ncbi:SIR2 family protein [Collimonas sp.]|jgi:hypothetical protein|uniref:SIR2 family protein n=1 Tax=Collimonas sp. TaxID=1963772 RepID=UPI002CA7B7D0|nr:SIR2 family protein [Collimonas sp.]HWX00020.1 SIR2 family protein [Collimonas sp.]
MSCLLLLGAGFSRNWGGWLASEAFEYLLGCPEVRGNRALSELLWRNQSSGGFEGALAELQVEAIRDPQRYGADLTSLRGAVTSMFNDMNSSFSHLVNFEPQNHADKSIRGFLTKFDAIFTLNQDLLLEYQYLAHEVSLLSNRRWKDSDLPGMEPAEVAAQGHGDRWISRWRPKDAALFSVDPGYQPYFKLHGSANWIDGHGGSMLVMGGNKAHAIGLSPILQWYQAQFAEYLARHDARLMVIGYGFRDEHINQIISSAVANNDLKLFVVSPDGADQARKVGLQPGAAIQKRTDLEDTFQRSLIGASRRSLREIFGPGDDIEFGKLLRFFAA